jgi:hypothetical protein
VLSLGPRTLMNRGAMPNVSAAGWEKAFTLNQLLNRS